MPQKITVDRVNRLSREGFVERLGPVYESTHPGSLNKRTVDGRSTGLMGCMARW